MTIVVSIKVTDGVVLASDSATSFADKDGVTLKVYNNANKVFNLIKGCPIGAMTYGSGAIGASSIATLSKDLRRQMSAVDSPYYVDHQGIYTVRDIALKAQRFFQDRFCEAYPDGAENYCMGYRVIGYSSVVSLAEGYEMYVTGKDYNPILDLYTLDTYGPRWAGEPEALDRLILGHSGALLQKLRDFGLTKEVEQPLMSHLGSQLYRQLYLPAMPIQDAIDLARFLAETAARFSHFSMNAATIGGPIEIATITKHEGFKWVARKHYFTNALNPEANYV